MLVRRLLSRRVQWVRNANIDLRPLRPDEAVERTAGRVPRKGEVLSCHRVQRVASPVEARSHSRCPGGVERAARNVVPSAHPSRSSCSGQGRTGKQLVANRLHSQRNRVDNMPGDPLLFVGCWVAHRDAPYNHSTSRTRVTGDAFGSPRFADVREGTRSFRCSRRLEGSPGDHGLRNRSPADTFDPHN